MEKNFQLFRIIAFDKLEIPSNIKIACLNVSVEQYKPYPLCCPKRQKGGLVSKEKQDDERELSSESRPTGQKMASIIQGHYRVLEKASTHLITPDDREIRDQNEVTNTKA